MPSSYIMTNDEQTYVIKKLKNFMKIGIDCLEIDPKYVGGVNSYLGGLMEGFKNIKKKNDEFVIFCCPLNKDFLKYYSIKYGFRLVNINYYNKYFHLFFVLIPFILNSKKLWKIFTNFHSFVFGVNKKFERNCDIIYVASTVLNSYNLKIPTLLSMHDIQHVHFPEFFSALRLRG